MTIVIQGAGTINKGAQLMLEAIVERLGSRTQLVAQPQSSDFFIRAQLGLLQSTHMQRIPAISSIGGNLLPDKIKVWYGLAADKDMTGILDASGFAFSDSFALKGIKFRAKSAQYRAKRGLPLVMLPQAFGPFEDPEKAKWSKLMLESSTQIYVRDRVSATMLDKLNVSTPIKLSPDFTIGLAPADIERIHSNPFAAIVPNMKMIETGKLSEPDYVQRLSAYGNAAKKNGLDVVVVIHETGDSGIAQKLADQLSATTYRSEKPRELKAALGQAELVISSRFHAVVGGLSQTTPTIALGWSHKYRELLQDFGVEDWIDTNDVNPEDLVKSILADTSGKESMARQKKVLVQQVEEMWQETERTLKIQAG